MQYESDPCVSKVISVVLGEDHALMREGTRRILAEYADLRIVGEAEDGQMVFDLVERLLPDVVLLDIRMPLLNGIDVIRKINDRKLSTKTIALTAFEDDAYVIGMLEAGAAGYLLKSVTGVRLADSIRRVCAGEIVVDPRIAAKVLRIWEGGPISARKGAHGELTEREKTVLALGATGLRNKDIAEKLCLSARTVDSHFYSILSKLEVTSRTAAVLYALNHHLVELPSR